MGKEEVREAKVQIFPMILYYTVWLGGLAAGKFGEKGREGEKRQPGERWFRE